MRTHVNVHLGMNNVCFKNIVTRYLRSCLVVVVCHSVSVCPCGLLAISLNSYSVNGSKPSFTNVVDVVG